MNKTTLVEALYERRGGDDIRTKAAAERIVSDILELLADGIVNEGSAHFVGFGSFDIVKRAPRSGIDPQTKKKIKIPATKAVRFKPGQALKERAKKSKAV